MFAAQWPLCGQNVEIALSQFKGYDNGMNADHQKSGGIKPSDSILDDAVRRILSVVEPRRIILFGSAARGTMEAGSDLDLLIVMPDGIHRRQTSVEIFKALRGIGLPKDVIVVTQT